MNRIRPLVVAVVTAAAGLITCATFAQLAQAGWSAVTGPGVPSPAAVLLALVTSAGFLLSLWLAVGTAISALAALPGAFGAACAAVADRIAPAAVRKGIALVLGTAIAAAVAPGTAVAAVSASVSRQPAATRVVEPSPGASSSALPDPALRPPGTGDPAPDPGFRPLAPPAPPVDATLGPLDSSDPRARGAVEEQYVVRRGDSLWHIAARHLGPWASATSIAREWPRWYAVNRDVIGPDPHHIEPGQRLLPPGPAGSGAAQ